MAVRKIKQSAHKDIIKLVKTQTLQEVGDAYGVTRERIRQILSLYDLKTPKKQVFKYCKTPGCPKTFTQNIKTDNELCKACYAYKRTHEKNPEMKRNRRAHELVPICKIESCARPVRARALCNYHYNKEIIYSNPEAYNRRLEYYRRATKERYHSDPEYRARISERTRRWQRANKERVNAMNRRAYRLKKQNNPTP